MKHRLVTRMAAVVAAAVVVTAPMAAAHVTLDPGEATKGGYAALTFRVPSERDDTSTTRVEVNFPTAFTSVRVQPKPGWEYSIEHRTLDEPIENHGEEITEVVSKVTWTGGSIGPTEFEEFGVSVGRLPTDVDQVLFPTIQTYESGEVVRWIDEPAAEGEEEPESPAPALTLVDEEDEGAAATSGSGDEAAGVSVENAATQDDVDGANTMGIAGIVVGIIGLLVGGFALVRTRREATST